MQLNKLSIATILALGTYVVASDDISLNLLYYNENDDRVSAVAPFISYNKEIGTDYKFHIDTAFDTVSGATPTWSGDGASGASQDVTQVTQNIKYTKVNFKDKRAAINSNLLIRDEMRNEYTLGAAFSAESDYKNLEFYSSMMGYFDDFHNSSYSISLSYAKNLVGYEQEDDDSDSGASPSIGGLQDIIGINTTFTHNINDHSLLLAGVFMSYESGYLSNIHLLIARDYIDGTTHLDHDNRPTKKLYAGPIVKYNLLLNDLLTLNTSYRYYKDSWSVDSHTVDVGFVYEYKNISFNPKVRYYRQSQADFYSDSHFKNSSIDIYASSDERLSKYSSITYNFNTYYQYDDRYRYNIGFNYFSQTTGLSGYFFTLGVNAQI